MRQIRGIRQDGANLRKKRPVWVLRRTRGERWSGKTGQVHKWSMENLARYIIRASFSQERMQYLADEGTVIYAAKSGNDRKVFDAPEWLAAMCSHVPNRREQMVRYYGWYSNVTRGKRQKEGSDEAIPCILKPQGNEKIFRRKLGASDSENRSLSPRRRGMPFDG
ncbi:MAG: transposase [Deltaproteobacteria bacterium]|nr:transposase [Deltaproteobacteria bacterium]